MVKMDIIKRKFTYCRYGLLFFIGLLFGGIGMFYKSFDITRNYVKTSESAPSYLWSESEKRLVPFQENRLQSSANSQPVQYVMILSYMRSGSTFTADVIQHHPDAFYVFEPLISLVDNGSITYLNGTHRNFTTEAVKKEKLVMLERWYNCDLYNIDIDTLKLLFMAKGIRTIKFYYCIGKSNQNAKIMKCLPKLIEDCKSSKIRIIKTLPVEVEETIKYLNKFPKFRMIHLIRDPRGVMNSRIKVDPIKYGEEKMPASSRYLCYLMGVNMNNTFELMRQYPNRITVLHYEDLAEYPYSTTARLYSFLDLSVSLEIFGYIYHITAAGTSKEMDYEVERSNSISTANKWKKDLRYREIKIIDSECKNQYPVLGYLPVTNSSYLRDGTSLSTRVQ